MSSATRPVVRRDPPVNRAPAPVPTPADAPAARILAAVAALTLGAVVHFTGIAVRRISLLTYDVAGFALDLPEVPVEVTLLAAERAAIQDEPSLYRAAEIVARRHMTSPSRGFAGRFSVRRRAVVDGRPVFAARWIGEGADARVALEDLAAWARGMGLRASRVGCEVIASLPPSHAKPSLAKTAPRAASRAA